MIEVGRAAVLVLLRESSDYGYNLITRFQELGLSWNSGTVYRILRSMEKDGLVTGAWEINPEGPPRRMYCLAPAGRTELDAIIPRLAAHYEALGVALHAFAEQE